MTQTGNKEEEEKKNMLAQQLVCTRLCEYLHAASEL